jgi:hypothetical protein
LSVELLKQGLAGTNNDTAVAQVGTGCDKGDSNWDGGGDGDSGDVMIVVRMVTVCMLLLLIWLLELLF